ncbi:hypothetical protein KJ780_04170 [Candidatus Micrarchaeota archaeon]|nr:hypothetical protein [Candidatus Micrarchaeota archaeon]
MIIPYLLKNNIIGKDVNKLESSPVAEMGGIGIVAGFSIGVLCAIFFHTFLGLEFNLDFVFAALVCIFMLAFIGFVDDLLDVPQVIKAFLPLLAAIPLIAVRSAGSTVMSMPFIGAVDLGIFYFFILIPIGIAVASNLTNMLAGFNGIEAGMGIVMLSFASAIAALVGSADALVIYIPMIGALLGFLFLNWYPARIFPGDVGTLVIGATLAAGCIIGNFESSAAFLMSLYVIDFFIKAANRFPSSKWWGELKEGKLYPIDEKVRGFAQLIMKMRNGISEQRLVLFFIGLEFIIGIVVLFVFFGNRII